MENILRSATRTALTIVSHYLPAGGTAIDATCGNGNDTVALARLGAGKIYAFDIQAEAIARTQAALRQAGFASPAVDIRLIHDGHEHMSEHVREKVHVVMFNLGYLPAAGKTIITRRETTVKAVREALSLLTIDGLLCIIMYSGHDGGREEKEAVLSLAEKLDSHCWHTIRLTMTNQQGAPPELLFITRKTAGS